MTYALNPDALHAAEHAVAQVGREYDRRHPDDRQLHDHHVAEAAVQAYLVALDVETLSRAALTPAGDFDWHRRRAEELFEMAAAMLQDESVPPVERLVELERLLGRIRCHRAAMGAAAFAA